MQYYNSNQLEAVNAAAGKEMKILRVPSLTGKATERKTWYKASQLWSASSQTKNPEAAVKFINWLVNSPESANINLAERGIPANTEMLALVQPKLSKAQQTVAKFITDIKPELATTPDRSAARRRHARRASCSAPVPTSLFGELSPADAAYQVRRRAQVTSDGVTQ